MSLFDELNKQQTPLTPGADPDQKYSSFMEALQALRTPRQAAPAPEPPPPPPTQQAAPQAPRGGVGLATPLKGLASGVTETVGGAIRGVGIWTDDQINTWLHRLERIPAVKDVIYLTGLGDDTLIDEGIRQLQATRAGEGEVPYDPMVSSSIYKAGSAFTDWSREAMGITPEEMQSTTFKVTNAIGQAVGMVGEALAVGAAGGPAAAYAAVMSTGAAMQLDSTYARNRSLGMPHEESLQSAERVATVMGVLEGLSMIPALGATGKGVVRGLASVGAEESAARVAKTTAEDPVARALEKALIKRGLNVRNPLTRRVVGGVGAGIAEGAEEVGTGIYEEADLKWFGGKWSPRKTWSDILLDPQRFEEFALGFVGGAAAVQITSGGVHFTEERKQAARKTYEDIKERRGEAPVIDDHHMEVIFRRAEGRLDDFHKLTQEQIVEEIKRVREAAPKAKSVAEEIELMMLLDGLYEIQPHARSEKQSNAKVSAEEARAKARRWETEAPGADAATEEGVVAGDVRNVFLRFGEEGLQSLKKGIYAIRDKVSGVAKRKLERTASVLNKVEEGVNALEKENAAEAQAQQQEAEATQLRQQVAVEDLTAAADDQIQKFQKSWTKPESRAKAAAALIDPSGTVQLRTGNNVPAVAVTSFMLDRPAGVPDLPPGTTVREALSIAFNEMAQQKNAELEKQVGDAQMDSQKMLLKMRQQEAKEQQQRVQEFIQVLKTDDQLRQLSMKEEADALRMKEAEAQANAKALEQKRQLEEKEKIRQEKEAEREKVAKEKEAAAAAKKAEANTKPAPKKKTTKKKAAPKKEPAKNKTTTKPKTETPVKKKTSKKAAKQEKVKAEVEQGSKDLREAMNKPAAEAPVSEAIEPVPAETTVETSAAPKFRPNRGPDGRFSKRTPGTEDPVIEASKSRDVKKAEPPPPPVHEGPMVRIKLGDGKVRNARVDGRFKKDGVEYVNWSYQSEGGWKKQKARPTLSFQKLMLAAQYGKLPPSYDIHKAFDIDPIPVPDDGSVTPTLPPPTEHPNTPADEVHEKPLPKWRWYHQFITFGNALQHTLGQLGTFIHRYGLESERLSMQMQGQHRRDHNSIETWLKSDSRFATTLNGGVRKITNGYKKFYKAMLGAKDFAAERTRFASRVDADAVNNRAMIDEMSRELGLDPAHDLYQQLDHDAATTLLEYSRQKANDTSGEEKTYWSRYADYIEDAITNFPDDTLTIMHSIESVDSKFAFLMPYLVASRHYDNTSWHLRMRHATSKKAMAPRVQNHVYEGVSPTWRRMAHKKSPAFMDQFNSVVDILIDDMSKGTEAADKMWLDLGIDRATPEAVVRKRVEQKVWGLLTTEASSPFAKKVHSFGSFVKARKGAWGLLPTDWSMGGFDGYLDKAARDIAENEFMRDFMTTPNDGSRSDGAEALYHNEKLPANPNEVGTVEEIRAKMAEVAHQRNSTVGVDRVMHYLDMIRGRDFGQDALREVAGFAARYTYATKLGHLATIVRNMSVLLSSGMLYGPINALAPFAHLHRFGEMYGKALGAGAAPAGQAIFLEQEHHVASDEKGVRKVANQLAHALLFPFKGSEIAVRTMAAHSALAFWKGNVEALQNPAAPEIHSLHKLFGISKATARHNLEKLFHFKPEEIDALENGRVPRGSKEMAILEDKAMYYGSNLINFRSGPNYTMTLLAGNSAAQTFFRTFNSYSTNVVELLLRNIYIPMVKGDANARINGVKNMLKVYVGGALGAQVVDGIINGLFRDSDDEDDLKGDSEVAQFAWNRINDFNTVGLFGKFERPMDMINPLKWLSGVYGRSFQNIKNAGMGTLVGVDDIWAGHVSSGMKQFASTYWKLVVDEVTAIRFAQDIYRKWAVDEGTARKARVISRALEANSKDLAGKAQKAQQDVGIAVYAKERDAVVNALYRGQYYDAAARAGDYARRILEREGPEGYEKAGQRARSSVMMKAPLAEWSRTADIEQAKEELQPVLAELIKRRGSAEAQKLYNAHLAYVSAVAAIFPKRK